MRWWPRRSSSPHRAPVSSRARRLPWTAGSSRAGCRAGPAMLTITPHSDVAGARIEGVDLSRPLDATTFEAIDRAFHEHCFVVFPKQVLTVPQFVSFSRCWGPPEPHVIDTFHHPHDANVLMLSNVTRNGKPVGLLDAGTYFHTDYSYLEVPARCTMLY